MDANNSVDEMVEYVSTHAGVEIKHLSDDIYLCGETNIKITVGKAYLLVRSKNTKMQLVYGSRSFEPETIKEKFSSFIAGSESICVIYDGVSMDKKLSEKLGVEVVQYRKGDRTLFRVKTPEKFGFKTLSLDESGTKIAFASFPDHVKIDRIVGVSSENSDDAMEEIAECVKQMDYSITTFLAKLA